MKNDYWEEGDQVFVHFGKRYGINASGRTVCIGPLKDTSEPALDLSEKVPAKEHNNIQDKEVILQGNGVLYTTNNKVGRKVLELPDNTIRQLAFSGLGSKAIAKELLSQGVAVSYQTIERRLARVNKRRVFC